MTTTTAVMPAEWERHSMIQLTWPHKDTNWRNMVPEITAVYVKLAQAISTYEKLLIVTPYPEATSSLLASSLPAECMSRITLHKCMTNDTWARDHAFLSIRDTSKEQPITLLDFHFNGWGEKYPSALDDAINRSVYAAGMVKGIYEDNSDFVLEGGSIESDGKGTIFTTSPCLTAPHRNQPLDRDGIERELLKRLRARRIMWVDHGHMIGDDTDGHIDTLVRIAPNDTLIYMGSGDDESDPHYADLQLMEEQLRTFRTLDGKPYRLVRLPLPAAVCYDGERLPATYANFLILNGAVLIPTYAQPAKDEEAVALIHSVFPDREVATLDARQIIRQHGSVHCCAMQYYEK